MAARESGHIFFVLKVLIRLVDWCEMLIFDVGIPDSDRAQQSWTSVVTGKYQMLK